jgi:A/G-specific adenine glycosylase
VTEQEDARIAATHTRPLTADEIRRLHREILPWYDQRHRDLPWRREPTLYGTWISEMMLQQTTVATVVPYWERFVARFPDVASLAAASVPEVLAHWSGLGYYRRAHHLHAAAREVVANHGGRLPRSVEAWRTLPGIGPYAAGAIASIGLGLPVPAVDANVRRVVLRWLAPDAAAAVTVTRAVIDNAAAALVEPHRPGDWNQALMELGATVCRARSVACQECPAHTVCRAATGPAPARVGLAPERATTVKVIASALVAIWDDKVLLLPPAGVVVARVRGLGRPLRDDLGNLHRGLFAPLQTPWYRRGDDDASARLMSAWRAWLSEAGVCDASLRRAGVIRHRITHHDLKIEVFRLDVDQRAAAALDGCLDSTREWSTLRESTAEPGRPPLTTPARRCLVLGSEYHETG